MIQEQPGISLIIGACDTCGHGCVYCYANTDQEKASRAPAALDPAAPSLSVSPPVTAKQDPSTP